MNLFWERVENRMPDDDIVVLVALDNGEVWLAYHQGADPDAGIFEGWLYLTGDPVEVSPVTHWMHLPPAPEKEAA